MCYTPSLVTPRTVIALVIIQKDLTFLQKTFDKLFGYLIFVHVLHPSLVTPRTVVALVIIKKDSIFLQNHSINFSVTWPLSICYTPSLVTPTYHWHRHS